jgi:hypothetical protein
MEDMQGGRRGPQLYLLCEEGYESLKYLQDMLTLMAQIACSQDDDNDASTALTIGRAELCFIFEAINTRIDDVLRRVDDENWVGTQKHAWQ